MKKHEGFLMSIRLLPILLLSIIISLTGCSSSSSSGIVEKWDSEGVAEAVAALAPLGEKAGFLRELVEYLLKRNK